MAFELVYTSVPRGIRPGSSGFCTAAYTNGLAANLIMQLEGMSAYKAYFPHYDANASLNPVAFSHFIFSNSGGRHHILSRVCFYGLDYTKRSNKLAHHVVLSTAETASVPGGPACVFRQKGLFRTEWQGEPELFPKQLTVSPQDPLLRTADTWKQYTGDAGWAGALAASFLKNPAKPTFVIFDPAKHQNVLALVEEALMLLPPERRWQVAFNTYVTTMPAGLQCHWRFCVPDSDPLKEARRVPGTLIIDLTRPTGAAPDNEFAQIARTGVRPEPVKASVPQTPPPPRPAAPPPFQPPRQGTPFVPPPIIQRAPDLSLQPPPPPPRPKKTRSRSLLWGGVALGGILVVFIGLGVLLYTTSVPDSEPPEIEEQVPHRKQDSAAGSSARGSARSAASKRAGNTPSETKENADLKPLQEAVKKLGARIEAANKLFSSGKKKELEIEKNSLTAAREKLDAEREKLRKPEKYGNAKAIKDLLAKADERRQKAEEAVKGIDKRLKTLAAATAQEAVKKYRRYFWLRAKNLSTEKGKEWTSPEPLLAEGQSVKSIDIECIVVSGEMTQTFKDDVLTITRAYVRGGEVTSTPCFVCRIERVGGGKLRFKVEENKSKSVKWKGVTFSDGEELSFSFVQGKSLFPPDPPDKQHSVTITENKSKAQLDVSYVLTETDKDGGLGSLAGRIRFLDAKGKIADANVTEKGMMLVGNIPIKDQPLKEKFYELFVGKGLKERILEGQTAYIRDKKLKDEAQKLLSKLKPERKIWQQLISSDKGYDGMEIKDIKSILKKLKMTKLLGNIDQLKATSGKYTPSRAVEPPGKTDPDKLTKMAFQTAFEREFKTLKDKVNAYLKSIPTSSDDFLKKWEEMSKKGCSGYRYGEIRTMLNCLLTATISPEDGKPMDGELVELNKKFKELENLHKPGDRYVFVKGEESPEKRLRKNGVRAQIILKKDGKTLLKEIKKVEVK